MSETTLPPGMTIGILGGGQLGRMLALAAARLGFACHVFSPDRRSPAFAVASARTEAAYEDTAALAAFADAVDVITFEFENIPVDTVAFLAERALVRPGVRSLAVAQDRLAEKTLMSDLGIAVAPYAPVERMQDVYSALAKTGRPAVLKTRRMGYDGKGQSLIRQGDDPRNAWRLIGEAPAILEGGVAFSRELSVVLARAANGDVAAFDVAENRHRDGILRQTIVPASIGEETAAQAVAWTRAIAESLDHIGILTVEFFHTDDGPGPQLLANEIAPRVHNSGHHTVETCRTSQFEQHIRALVGWPLGSPERHSDGVMDNLIGDEIARWADLAADPAAALTVYGKAEVRPGRKMGHVTRAKRRES